MSTVAAHPHSFPAEDWPFSEPDNTLAFTTSRALENGEPILLVSHDYEGDWQFLCGDVTDEEQGKIICLGCAYQRDKSVGELADLPLGWQARRESVDAAWERYPVEEADDDEG